MSVKSTSSNSIEIGAGKAFTYTSTPSIGFAVGQRLRAAVTTSPTTQYMEGNVTSASTTSVTLTTDLSVGSGTYSGQDTVSSPGPFGGTIYALVDMWTLSVAGFQGTQGIQGVTGTQGIQGVTGSQGIQGIAGSQSATNVIAASIVSSIVDTDASAGAIFDVTATENFTLANPTNPTDGKSIRWRIKQDATGGREITLGTQFKIPSSANPLLLLSTAANATDLLAATYCHSRVEWDIIAFVKGY